MFSKSKKITCIAMSFLLILLSLSIIGFVPVSAADNTGGQTAAASANLYGLPDRTEDGVMINAYLWRFSDIKSRLREFAEAGYKSIQVSPVQRIKSSGDQWWLLYQPCNFHIGNRQLGSYEDFRLLCAEAENYGIKIIVDAVVNHVAEGNYKGTWSDEVDNELKRSDFYHNRGECDNYKNREKVTQFNLGGLPDLATQRYDVQDIILNFLNECIDAGADGFRFDATKHIETNRGEDAWKPWAGNFWDRVLGGLHNRSNLYLYGEVLPDDADNDEVYRQMFDITAHGYGGTVRGAVTSKNLTGVLNINHGDHSIPANEALCYLENHDDYEHNVSRSLGQWERKMAYAIIASRAQLTPNFFLRPYEDLWKDSDVKAVNKFHNAMVGKNEYLRWTRNETILIERGDSGVSIVNLGGDTYIDSPTNLKEGTYSNKASASCTLQVSGGRIRGNVPGGKIVVLYDEVVPPNVVSWNPQVPVSGGNVTITYNATGRQLQGSTSVKIHWGYDGFIGVTDTTMTSKGNNIWEVTLTVPAAAKTKLDFVFTDGSKWDNNNSQNWNIPINQGQPYDVVSWNPQAPVSGGNVTITYNATGRQLQGSTSVKIHWGYDGFIGVTDTTMTSKGNNIWEVTLTVPAAAKTKLDFVFTDGSKWDNNNSQNWNIPIGQLATVSWNPQAPVSGGNVTITYNATGRTLQGSASVKIHWGYDGFIGVTDTTMTSKGNNIWEVTLTVPAAAKTKLDFVFTDGSKWDNNNSQNWGINIGI
ncbi:MAG: carbohydrate-binding protein [Clostridia bacterium]|nr:carbohydrate-binding protein [Clostridia bacterium]